MVDDVSATDVVVYVGPKRHFVQYPLRGAEMFNQVAVFESPKAVAGEEDWGTPDELDAAFTGSCEQIRKGLPLMWRDRWWRMFDRDPIDSWLHGRVALLGDAAHPPLQYMAQGAVMALEDGWVLAEHVGAQAARRDETGSGVDWDAALAAYDAVRPVHCARVVRTARVWGELWHLDGVAREQRNAILRARDVHDYSFTDWVFGPMRLTSSTRTIGSSRGGRVAIRAGRSRRRMASRWAWSASRKVMGGPWASPAGTARSPGHPGARSSNFPRRPAACRRSARPAC